MTTPWSTQPAEFRLLGVSAHRHFRMRESRQIRASAAALNAADPGVSREKLAAMVDRLTPEEREEFERFRVWKHRSRGSSHDTSAPSPQQIYAEMMKATFGPALRGEGLRGSGGRFELPSEVYYAQLGFQRSAFSDGREVRFTVNLSVIRRDEWAAQRAARPDLGERPTSKIRFGAWADQLRIGELTPEGKDKWWRIVHGVNSSDVRDDVAHDLLTYGVPWLRDRVV